MLENSIFANMGTYFVGGFVKIYVPTLFGSLEVEISRFGKFDTWNLKLII